LTENSVMQLRKPDAVISAIAVVLMVVLWLVYSVRTITHWNTIPQHRGVPLVLILPALLWSLWRDGASLRSLVFAPQIFVEVLSLS
jgi:ABC-type nickel/cobalt efflux system permease component RcnA